jgi:hypothetical protein
LAADTVRSAMSICLSSMSFTPSFKPPQPAPERRGGRRRADGSPADGGGPHPKGRNAMEDPGAAGVAARRGGTRGERPVSPPVRGTGQRHRAGSAMSACPELELRARVSRSQPAWAETPSPARRRLGAVERGHAVRRGAP